MNGVASRVGNTRSVTGTYITVTNGTLTLNGVEFRAACDKMWGGFHITSTGKIRTNAANSINTRIADSFDGIRFNNNSFFGSNIVFTNFANNFRSVQFTGTTSAKLDDNDVRSINNCSFTSGVNQMKFPYETGSFVSYSHISNALSTTAASTPIQCGGGFSNNTFSNALYGMLLVNHGGGTQLEFGMGLGTFTNCHIAAIWHTAGNLTINGGGNNAITLPTQLLSTTQINNERALLNIPTTSVMAEPIQINWGRTYGIYSLGHPTIKYTDKLVNLIVVIGTNGQQVINNVGAGEVITLNEIGYYANNVTVDMRIGGTGTPAPGALGLANRFEKLRNGIILEGTNGSYEIQQTNFQDNLTAIHVNRNNTFGFRFTCNDFVNTDNAARTGLLLTGTGLLTNGLTGTSNKMGECTEVTGVNRPNGNEVRDARTSNANPDPTLPLQFTFIDNQLPSAVGDQLKYYRFNNENVEDVLSFGVNFEKCTSDADITSCPRTGVGTASRQGQKEAQVSQVSLGQNMPNPATGEGAIIAYQIPEGIGQAQLKVINNLGRIVYTETLTGTEGNVQLNTTQLEAGVYFYTLVLDGRVVKSRKMLVIK
jgi:hypothetical protein